MNRFIVKSIENDGKRLDISFDVSGSEEWIKCFCEPYSFFAEYNIDISGLPNSVAVIPVVANILTLSWIFNAEIIVDEIDRAFYESVPFFKRGFYELHRKYPYCGKLTANKIVENHSVVPADKTAIFFSGGSDATYTLISHIEEKPFAVTIWGADMPWKNEVGWNAIYSHVKNVCNIFGLDSKTIRSNFHHHVDLRYLNSYVRKEEPHSNWYEHFMFGPSFYGLTAPLAYFLGIKKFYLGSSYSLIDIGHFTSAADIIIDNLISYVDAVGCHDGFEANRQDKIHGICQFKKETGISIPLHVCFFDTEGGNCGVCEKCCRTMLGIIAEGENPKDFGFPGYNEELRAQMMESLQKKYWLRCRYGSYDYNYTQDRLRLSCTYEECPDDLKWFYKLKMRDHAPWWIKLYISASKEVHSILRLLHLEK